jgi:hypothetical protein
VQICDHDNFGIAFSGLYFCHSGTTYALGEQTNGWTNLGGGFMYSAEGRHALNNGEEKGFVFTAFQVLLVRPVEGLFVT